MKYTNTFLMKKPEETDAINISDLNSNTDIIDQELTKLIGLSRREMATRREILDIRAKLDEALVIDFINKAGIGYYDLFSDSSGLDSSLTTAYVGGNDVVFSGQQILKFKPQGFEAFSDLELAVYDKDRNVLLPLATVNNTNAIEISIIPGSLVIGDTLYFKGEAYSIAGIEVVS